jgi:hypothetical protein
VLAEALIIIIALEEYPIRMTITEVSIVFRTILFFTAINHTNPDTITSINILRNSEPETTHIPVKNSASTARKTVSLTFLLLFAELSEDFILKIKNPISRII